MNETEARLDRSRNVGCACGAVLDGASVDEHRVAAQAGFPPWFGQSQFAIVWGNSFEGQVKANGCTELLRRLHDIPDAPIVEASWQ